MTDVPAGYAPGYSQGVWSVEALVDLIVAVGASNDFDGATITNSTVNSSVIGGAVPAAAHVTTLSATGTATLVAINASGTVTANGSLVAANAVALSPASHNVVISPTGTGVVTINPATLGTLDKMTIGGATPAAITGTTIVGTTITATTLITATHTPASSSAAGVAGTVAWDAGFLYVCSATNTWLRVAIATW